MLLGLNLQELCDLGKNYSDSLSVSVLISVMGKVSKKTTKIPSDFGPSWVTRPSFHPLHAFAALHEHREVEHETQFNILLLFDPSVFSLNRMLFLLF